MGILTGVQNFLEFINENWTMIASIITLAIIVAKKVENFLRMSNEEKVKIAKAQINEIMLRLVTEAECDYQGFIQAGSIKRSQVIDEIFTMYPILSRVTSQEELIVWIDTVIDDTLKTMRDIFEENKANAKFSAVEENK